MIGKALVLSAAVVMLVDARGGWGGWGRHRGGRGRNCRRYPKEQVTCESRNTECDGYTQKMRFETEDAKQRFVDKCLGDKCTKEMKEKEENPEVYACKSKNEYCNYKAKYMRCS